MDVFDCEGRCLGGVRVRDGISPWPLPAVRGGMIRAHALAHVLDGFDVAPVVEYRFR